MFEDHNRNAPRSSTPHARSFSENLWVTLAAEVSQVGVTESSTECFSSALFVESRILLGSSMRRPTLKKGEEGKRESGFGGSKYKGRCQGDSAMGTWQLAYQTEAQVLGEASQ